MVLIGLTGGIGSGKSTVSALLAERGALVIDADAITRELQQPGTPVFAAMRERFGDGDRRRRRDARPAGGRRHRVRRRRRRSRTSARSSTRPSAWRSPPGSRPRQGPHEVVVLDVPLLVESGRDDMAALVVVDVDPEVAVERLVSQRGMREDDVRARMANQADRAERLARADHVLDNSGSIEELRAQVDELWVRLLALGADS